MDALPLKMEGYDLHTGRSGETPEGKVGNRKHNSAASSAPHDSDRGVEVLRNFGGRVSITKVGEKI